MHPPSATLLDLLSARARENPQRVALSFEGEDTTFAELDRDASRFARHLLEIHRLEPGARVLMALPNGTDFFAAFFGTERAGGVPVPLFPGSGPERLRKFVRLAGADALVLPADVEAQKIGVPILRVADGAAAPPEGPFPTVVPEDLAFLQYTSGSTGDPKGVELTHANLMVNLEHLIAGFEITDDDVFVSWLPAYHDMGLILMTLVPFRLAARLVLLPTSLASVERWLEAIEEHRGTFTAAPDFAYRLCLRRIHRPESYDLSSLRVALDAAEPVRASTLERFHAAFGLDDVMIPGYGLAEATVGVSGWRPGTPVKVDERGLVSIGKPFPGVEMRILAGGEWAKTGQEGEIVVRSRATCRGYFRNPRATEQMRGPDDFIRTGDLGYRDGEGDFFIVGRRKNILIHGGRNLAPQEIEEIVDTLPGVRFSAAVGIDRGGVEGEQVHVLAEVRADTSSESWPEMVRNGVERLHAELGFRPAGLYLVRPHALPLTPNGKLRHAALREAHRSGQLRRSGAILFPIW